jgi:excisionase family DNA binding protein
MIDELAAFLTVYVRTRQAVTGGDGDYGTSQDVPVVRRLLITKAEAADQLGISVRTVERLISAGRIPLVHVEGAARLRVADLEAYVAALVPLDAEQSERANAD